MGKNVIRFKAKDGNYYDVKDNTAREELETKGDVIEDTASGTIATFQDGADNLPMSVTAEITPVQDLHGQESPWPAGGGKNKYDMGKETQTINDVKFTRNADGSYTVSGTASASASLTGEDIELPAGSYICSAITTGTNNINASVYVNGTWQFAITTAERSLTLSEDSDVHFVLYVASGQTPNITFYPMIRLASVSDATFAPYSNICPISGWTGANVSRTGKNLIDGKSIYTGSNFTWNGDEVTSTAARFYAVKYTIPKALIGKTLTFQAYAVTNGSVNLCACAKVNGSNIVGSAIAQNATGKTSVTFTPSTIDDTIFINYGSTGGGSVTLKEFMLTEESTASEYKVYQGKTYTIEFPTPPGTVYSGTLTVNEDGTGTLTVDKGYVSSNSASDYSRNNATQYYMKSFALPGIKNATTPERCILSDKYKSSGSTSDAGACFLNGQNIRFNTAIEYASVAEMLTGEGVPQFVYPLATPVTYQLTNQQVIETLKGVNNVWADTGNVSVEYPADTKLFIDKKIAELQAIILEN